MYKIAEILDTIICGDSLEVMKEIPDNSIDLIVTDPPYGYSFMGKDWDKVVIPMVYWKECLRVLKSGSFCFVMSAPRQDVLSRAIYNLQDAGFNTGFTSIYFTYASGFPKASNIGKMVDKKLGAERGSKPIDKPATPQAKALDGSYGGFQPKPAVEVIIVCMKPLSEKTYVDQAMKNKKGITWLDDGRIPYESEGDEKSIMNLRNNQKDRKDEGYEGGWKPAKLCGNNQGRFPANLLVSDDVLNNGRVTQSRASGYNFENSNNENPTHIVHNIKSGIHFPDSGSFSRYFDLDKWFCKTFPFAIICKASKREKNRGCENMPLKKKWMKGGGGTGISARENIITKNFHPTCKPIKLGTYLITLGSREGDIVLDPFAGSGTFCISAKMLNRKYIGIDNSKEYCDIAEARIKAIPDSLFKEVK